MIISPPFLPKRRDNETDAGYVNRAMSGSGAGPDSDRGVFPLGHDLNWHGGRHIEAPAGEHGKLPVRAIADGTVVYRRDATPIPEHRSADMALNYGGGWTSDGVVVIRHDSEIGDGPTATVRYYSITMHLHEIAAAVQAGRPIWRKDRIGQAGYIQGEPDRIHFELVCDDDNLARLIGRNAGRLALDRDGRSDAGYGQIYFALPAGTPIFSADMREAQRAANEARAARAGAERAAEAARLPSATERYAALLAEPPARLTSTRLFVGLDYRHGDLRIGTWLENGTPVGTPTEDPVREYTLYEDACALYPACPSAGYELLRFGRVLGPDLLAPADAAHWRLIRHPYGEGWVDLRPDAIRKSSDADFPHWRGWTLIDDHRDGDSRADSVQLAEVILGDGGLSYDRKRLLAGLSSSPDARERLQRTICKLTSEWDARDFDRRYRWLTESHGVAGASLPKALSAEDFARLKAHVIALSFWSDTGLDERMWHFDPAAFIGAFRACGWLSKLEFAQCIPRRFVAEDNRAGIIYASSIPYPVALTRAANIHREFNRMTRKFLITPAPRLACFLANANVESLYFSKFFESNRGADRGYGDWYGRGIIQLTHEQAYLRYFAWRGWSTLDRSRTVELRDAVETDPHERCETAGYWWAGNKVNRLCDDLQPDQAWAPFICEQYRWQDRSCAVPMKTSARLSNPTLDRVARLINTGSTDPKRKVNNLPERRDCFAHLSAVILDKLYDDGAGANTAPFPRFLGRQIP